MGFKFNPFTGTLDTVDSPSGVFEELDVNGDITLDDGGTYTTTLQTITATADRTISLPNATGTVALVAGSSGQLVYNNAGAYAGVLGSTVGATGNVTLGLNGAASVPPAAVTGTWFTGGTSTTTKPQVLIEPTGTTSTAWSTSGTGLGVNAASGFTGHLFNFQVNGSDRIYFRANDNQLIVAGGIQAGNFSSTSSPFTLSNLGLVAASLTLYNTSTNTSDVFLARDAANTLAQRNGTNAQVTRVYDTFTSDTDYHRIAIATARATLTGVSGASVTATSLIPAGAVVLGVTSKVTTALGTSNGTTGYQVGTAADADRWGAITGTALGTTSDNRNWTAGTIECFPAATNVIVTATGGNFNGTGVIYLSVQYMTGQAD